MLKSTASISSVSIQELIDTVNRAPAEVGTARAVRRAYNSLFQDRPVLQLRTAPFSSRSKAYKAREMLMSLVETDSELAYSLRSFSQKPFVSDPIVHAEKEGFIITVELDKDETLSHMSYASGYYRNTAFHLHMKNVAKFLKLFQDEETFENLVAESKAAVRNKKLAAAEANRQRTANMFRLLQKLSG